MTAGDGEGRILKCVGFERSERPVGCFLFSSAGWKAKPRDLQIAGDTRICLSNLQLLVRNTRAGRPRYFIWDARAAFNGRDARLAFGRLEQGVLW